MTRDHTGRPSSSPPDRRDGAAILTATYPVKGRHDGGRHSGAKLGSFLRGRTVLHPGEERSRLCHAHVAAELASHLLYLRGIALVPVHRFQLGLLVLEMVGGDRRKLL